MADYERSEIEGKVNDIGKLEAHVHYEFRGDEELLLRSVFRRVPESNWSRVAENINSGLGEAKSPTSSSVIRLRRKSPSPWPTTCTKPNFLDWSKKKTQIILPLVQFSLPDVDDDQSDADAEPLKLGPKGEYSYKVKLELPTKYTAHAPLAFSLKRDYAEYEATYHLEGGTFTAGRKLTLHQDDLPVTRAADYQSFRRAVGSDLAQHWRSKVPSPELSFLQPT